MARHDMARHSTAYTASRHLFPDSITGLETLIDVLFSNQSVTTNLLKDILF